MSFKQIKGRKVVLSVTLCSLPGGALLFFGLNRYVPLIMVWSLGSRVLNRGYNFTI